MPVTSAASASPRSAPSADPTARVAWASMVGTSLESFDFYVFAYFSAFFVGPLFFEPLGEFGETLAAFSTIALAFVVRPIGAAIFGHMGDRLGRRTTLLWTVGDHGHRDRGSSDCCRRTRRPAGSAPSCSSCCASRRACRSAASGADRSCSRPSTPDRSSAPSTPRSRSSARRSARSCPPRVFIVLTIALPTEDLMAWGWRIPFLLALPAPRGVAVPALVDRRDARLRERRGRGPSRPAAVRHAVPPASPARCAIAIGAALLGIGSYSLMNTYTINYGVEQLGFSFQDLLVATTIGALLQLVTIPLFGRLGDADRLGQGRRVGRARHPADRVPDVLPAAVRDLPDPGRDDDHRRHPADDVVGGPRRPHERPVPRPLPLLGAVDRVRDRRDGERIRARSSPSRSAARRTSPGGTRASCSPSSPPSRSCSAWAAARRQPEPEFTPALATQAA